MEKYHKRDIKLVEDKLPALTKVKHIDEIIEKLSKVRHYSMLKSVVVMSLMEMANIWD